MEVIKRFVASLVRVISTNILSWYRFITIPYVSPRGSVVRDLKISENLVSLYTMNFVVAYSIVIILILLMILVNEIRKKLLK